MDLSQSLTSRRTLRAQPRSGERAQYRDVYKRQGCDWSANIERAAVLPPATACEETCAAIEEVTTPDQHTIEEVCGFLKVNYLGKLNATDISFI